MNNLNLSTHDFGQYFDHTLLKASAQWADFEQLCAEGVAINAKTLAINPAAVRFCAERLEGSSVLICVAVGFPLGQATVASKVFESIDAIENGADEIDYVVNITELKAGNIAYITDEMQAIVTACRERNVVSKVIFETCYLTDDEKKTLCAVANRIKPDFIKTSTGFGTGGATLADIKLMRAYADAAISIKASGGIKTLADTLAMIEAGASRIGTSSAVAIIGEYGAS